MAKIAYILLCHKDPKYLIAQAERLTAAGDYVAFHFDARAKQNDYKAIRDALRGNPNVTFSSRRLKCGWGAWSLVDASLLALQAAFTAFPKATHFYMLSGDCMPVKSAEYIHDFLDKDNVDYIESFDFLSSDWIKTGIKVERLIYRHWFNERTQKWLFYTSLALQQKFGLTREIPKDITVQIGSQWWCLRRNTINEILNFCKQRPDVMRFFKTTWIPDETFFQTLVRHLVPRTEIRTRTLTFLIFTDYGMPVNFYNDHYNFLTSQDYLFARKISPDALELKQKLGDLYNSTGVNFSISGNGRSLYRFLTGRGRIGQRFAPRFWESEASVGRNRTLLIITCKKWHVAKRLVEAIKRSTDISTIEYMFDEKDTPLPDLGGIQTSLEKRTRHRRVLMRMLFEYWQTQTLVICLDPKNIELMQDFYHDKSQVRILEVECDFSDDYLTGHAIRVGLAGPDTPKETFDKILPTIRHDIKFESERIHDANFEHFYRIHQSHSAEENARQLEKFLSIPAEKALELAKTNYLFWD